MNLLLCLWSVSAQLSSAGIELPLQLSPSCFLPTAATYGTIGQSASQLLQFTGLWLQINVLGAFSDRQRERRGTWTGSSTRSRRDPSSKLL